MLSYRTNITGTPLAQRLPFRVLVLGQFSGNKARELGLLPDLDQRPIHSIMLNTAGASADDYLKLNSPWMMIPDSVSAQLGSAVVGNVSFGSLDASTTPATFNATIKTSVAKSQPPGTVPFQASITGTALFVASEQDNGSVDVRAGGMIVSGQISLMKDAAGKITVADPGATLNVVGAIVAPMTGEDGKSSTVVVVLDKSAKVTVPKGDIEIALSDNPDAMPTDTSVSYDLKIKDATSGKPKTYGFNGKRGLPFQSMASFTPDGLATAVPELHRLDVIRRLALDLQSDLRNKPTLRKAMRAALPSGPDDPDGAAKLTLFKALQTWAQSSFPKLIVDQSKVAAAATPPPAPPTDLQRALVASIGSVSDIFGTAAPGATPAPIALIAPIGTTAASPLKFLDRDPSVSDPARLMNSLAAVLVNIAAVDPANLDNGPFSSFADLFNQIAIVTAAIDAQTKIYLDGIMHSDEFRALEANWQGLKDLSSGVTADDVIIDFLDVTKDELGTDLDDNSLDIFSSALFHKVYINEYDSFGGHPFATMIGLYEFDSDGDIDWLRTMTKICAAAHCPFIAAVKPEFFLGRKTMQEVAAVTDLDAVLNHPKLAKWNALRDEDWSAYIGLTLPRYLVRSPWDAGDQTQGDRNNRSNRIGYVESVSPTEAGDANNFLWGNSAYLFARNIVRSYENSGWAQHIRGPIGGGTVDAMVAYTYQDAAGKEELMPPVEITIPDFREYQFSRNGLIALVQKKNEASATFFSAQSIKLPRDFEEQLNTQNAYLVTNLAYTFSITIISHYVKVMMRQYIGSSADAPYIQQIIAGWLSRFVTTVTNPDDLTLLYYPFKATQVLVEPKPGPLGWYMATISILPHIQFEGMDVELRLEAALGGKQ